MIAKQTTFLVASVAMFWCFMAPAKAMSFFVDKGHTDVVEGVVFEIVPPQLFIKKAFKLRDENLSHAELRLIQEAMPAIAAMTQEILRRPSNLETDAPSVSKPRSIYKVQNIASPIQLYIQTLKNWQVTETSIQFSSDYFYSPTRGHVVNFRDSYVFTKAAQGWAFSNHPTPLPDGLLICKKTPDAWMRCELPPAP
jgi:hypothetical protein